MSGYRDRAIYQLSYDLAVKIHKLTLEVPQYESYEEGRQIRRSKKFGNKAITRNAQPVTRNP